MKVTSTTGLSNQFVYRPTRRRFVQAALGLPAAVALAPLFAPGNTAAATATEEIPPHALRFVTPGSTDPGHKVVIIFMQGGLSFFDTFDPKSNSPFKQIDTASKDIKITEPLMPLAKYMNKALVVNNLYGGNGFHDTGAAIVFTSSPKVNGSGFFDPVPNTNPFLEFSEVLTNQASKDIGYVVLHQNDKDANGFNRLFERPWDALKPFDPQTVYSAYDTNTGKFSNPFRSEVSIDRDRFRSRVKLLEIFDEQGYTLAGQSVERRNRSYQKAVSLLDGDFNKTFDLSTEPAEALKKYGESKIGKQLLLTRRMLQQNARVVVDNDGNYDNHYGLKKDMELMLPPFAQALTALLDDIEQMDEKVYVAIVSEFGRTPDLNSGAQEFRPGGMVSLSPGRDHWTNAFGMVIFGNCLEDGRVIGRTNNKGEIVGKAYAASLVGDTILDLLGVGRFETRGEVVTGKRFPYIDIKNAG